MSESNPASLLSLPPELRNEIYSYLFEKDNPNPLNPIEVLRGWQSCSCSGRALLQACRQLRHETIPIFYGNHNIQFLISSRHIPELPHWVDTVSESVIESIRRFHLVDADYIWAINDCIMSREVCFVLGKDGVEMEVSEGFMQGRWDMPYRLAKWDVYGSLERRGGVVVLTRCKLKEMIDVSVGGSR